MARFDFRDLRCEVLLRTVLLIRNDLGLDSDPDPTFQVVTDPDPILLTSPTI